MELTKRTIRHIPGQLPAQELVQQLWDALSTADPTEYIQLICQGLSGFFTSIPVERFHEALQVILHQYDIKVGLNNVSHWSVYEVKSDHRRRIFKGKMCDSLDRTITPQLPEHPSQIKFVVPMTRISPTRHGPCDRGSSYVAPSHLYSSALVSRLSRDSMKPKVSKPRNCEMFDAKCQQFALPLVVLHSV